MQAPFVHVDSEAYQCVPATSPICHKGDHNNYYVDKTVFMCIIVILSSMQRKPGKIGTWVH